MLKHLLFCVSIALVVPTLAKSATLLEVGALPKFEVFRILAEAADNSGRLIAGASYTIFAPENDAFGKVPRRLLNELWIPAEGWSHVFWHHVVQGSFSELKPGQRLQPVFGEALEISRSGERFFVNGHPILDVRVVSNGVVYTIDSLLVPEAARKYIQDP